MFEAYIKVVCTTDMSDLDASFFTWLVESNHMSQDTAFSVLSSVEKHTWKG